MANEELRSLTILCRLNLGEIFLLCTKKMNYSKSEYDYRPITVKLGKNATGPLTTCLLYTSPSAGNKGRELLSIAMKDAAGDKFINYNPMPETKPYPRAKPKVRVLSKEKLKVFLEAASKNPWYLEILLGLFCGLRKGEILGLKFQDFDFEKQTVRISRQLVGNLKLKEKEFTVTEYAVIERNPKTENSYRILRVPKVVMQEVKRRQQLIELRKTDSGIEYKNYDYVSCQENGEPRSLTAMNQALTKICKRNGLPNITVPVSYTHLDVYKRQIWFWQEYIGKTADSLL